MRARTFNILILLVIVSVGAATYIVSRSVEDPRFTKIGQPVFPGLLDQVKKITEKQRELDLDTAQIPYEDRDHAWFVAFGPYKNPRYSICVFVEHGGSGSKAAAPLAKKVIKKVIDRHEEREKIRKRNLVDI